MISETPSQIGHSSSALRGLSELDTVAVNAATVDAGSQAFPGNGGASAGGCPASLSMPVGGRTTVLPRIEGMEPHVRLVAETKLRYEPISVLGAGGMGEVLLVHDQDIARKVAIKRLLPEGGQTGLLARFVDEIRTVGRLEHPNIVPIHDVGVDEQGRYFFVMKYVEGETLESIIEKLSAGDPAYHRKYTFELRTEIFIQVLHALAYAHTHGIVHRDIKPANVMIGRFGEVMLMDWGIAKPLSEARDMAAAMEGVLVDRAAATNSERAKEKKRMYATRVGALVGTPAYMSPEQARGDNHRLDARTDLYSSCAMFYEFLSLRHYLGDKETVEQLIAGVLGEEVTSEKLLAYAFSQPHQTRPPVELLHWIAIGLAKQPENRFDSAESMIASLQNIQEGRCEVKCQVTMTKRMFRELAHLLDRHPFAVMMGFYGVIAMMLTCVGLIVYLAAT